jgi:REP element-mobilizing transposase RayT
MPLPGKRWYHVTFSTYNSWLPGDPRGFRSKHHRIHSSGDHRNPPPKGEHAGLHAHAKAISGRPVILETAQRITVGKAVVQNLLKHGHDILVISVSAMHVHTLAQLSEDLQQAKDAVGFAKLSASIRIKDDVPGQVWARGCKPKPIRDEIHHRNTFGYICRHLDEGAWVWTFRDGPIEAAK